jgi:hypothetical protein
MVGVPGRQVKVVQDHHDRGAPGQVEVAEQIEHLHLVRNVEERGRLVEQEHVGLLRQRHRDPDPLPLPTRQLVDAALSEFERAGCLERRRDRCVVRGAPPLAMLWWTYEKDTDEEDGTVSGKYVQTYAVSRTGKLQGPWSQRKPLLRQDSGHGMIFTTLRRQRGGRRTMLVVHRPFTDARGKLYEITLRRDGIELGRQRTDLDGGD